MRGLKVANRISLAFWIEYSQRRPTSQQVDESIRKNPPIPTSSVTTLQRRNRRQRNQEIKNKEIVTFGEVASTTAKRNNHDRSPVRD
jgi:hypothetical protein